MSLVLLSPTKVIFDFMFYFIQFLSLFCKVCSKFKFAVPFMRRINALKDSCIEKRLLPIVRIASKEVSYFEVEPSNNVWVLWLQGEEDLPELIKMCINSMHLWMKDWDVTVLSSSNLFQFTNLSEDIIKKYKRGLITRTHMSDIIRANLLFRHGGLWLDATVLLTGRFPKFDKKKYWTIKSNPDLSVSCVSKARWNGSIMYCPKGHFFVQYMSLCYRLYWEKYNKLIDYFLIDYFTDMALIEMPSYKKEFDTIPIYPYDINKLNRLLDKSIRDVDIYQILNKETIQKFQRRNEHKSMLLDGNKTVYEWLLNNNNCQ